MVTTGTPCCGLTLLFTTSPASCNYLKKTHSYISMNRNIDSKIICMIFNGLVDEVTSRYDDLFVEIRAFFPCFFSKTKSVPTPSPPPPPPHFFCIFGMSNLEPNFRQEMKQISIWEDFRANVLNWTQMAG